MCSYQCNNNSNSPYLEPRIIFVTLVHFIILDTRLFIISSKFQCTFVVSLLNIHCYTRPTLPGTQIILVKGSVTQKGTGTRNASYYGMQWAKARRLSFSNGNIKSYLLHRNIIKIQENKLTEEHCIEDPSKGMQTGDYNSYIRQQRHLLITNQHIWFSNYKVHQ